MYSLIALSSSPPPGSSITPQCKGKGKLRLGTSPSAVPAKRSAQGEDSEEEEDEVTAGSAARRMIREGSHMTSHMTVVTKSSVTDTQGERLP